jgi:hypothetical protein
MFLYRQGRVAFDDPDMDLAPAELDALRIETQPSYARLRHLGPVVRMSETQPYWDKPTPVLGSSKPEWLPR